MGPLDSFGSESQEPMGLPGQEWYELGDRMVPYRIEMFISGEIMKRLSVLVVGIALLFAPAAHALPFIDMGAKVGMGKTLYKTDNDEFQRSLDDLEDNKILALGVAARFQVAVVQLEANALYWGETIDGDATGVKADGDATAVKALFVGTYCKI